MQPVPSSLQSLKPPNPHCLAFAQIFPLPDESFFPAVSLATEIQGWSQMPALSQSPLCYLQDNTRLEATQAPNVSLVLSVYVLWKVLTSTSLNFLT